MEVSEIILCVDLSYQIDDTYNLDDIYALEDTDSFERFIIYLFNITETFEGLYIDIADSLILNVSSTEEIVGEITASDELLLNISEEVLCVSEIINIADSLNLSASYKITFEANTSGRDPPIINVEYKDYDEEIYCDENHQLDDEYVFNDKFEFDSLFNYIFNIHTSSLNIYNSSEDINKIDVSESETIFSDVIPLLDELGIAVNEVAIVNIISGDMLEINVDSSCSLQNNVYDQDNLFVDVLELSSIQSLVDSFDILNINYDSETFINSSLESNDLLNINSSSKTETDIIIQDFALINIQEDHCDNDHHINDEYIFDDKEDAILLFDYIFNVIAGSLDADVLNEDIEEININEDVELYVNINSSDTLKLGYNSEVSINSNLISDENLNLIVNEIPNITNITNSSDLLKICVFEIHDKTSILLYKLTYEELKNAQDNCWKEEIVCDSQLLINENYMLEEDDRFEILFSHLLLSPWKNVWEQYVKVNGKWKRIKINGIYQKVQGEWKTSK